ncbi:MAG: SCP2 sterol-binding domain-containing protein [Streptosporangiaceae bacterium]
MATAEDCRKALETLVGRIATMNPEDRAAHFPERTMSARVPDLGLLFTTRLGPHGADPVEEAAPSAKPAQIRFTASSDDLVWVAEDPARFARAWLSGKLKVEASFLDLLQFRKFL